MVGVNIAVPGPGGYVPSITSVLPVSADAWLNSSVPNGNFNNDYMQAASIAETALVKFDLSSLAGRSIVGATLTLWTGNANEFTINVSAYRIADANVWIENQCAWSKINNVPTAWAGSSGCKTAGTDYDATPVGPAVLAPNDDAARLDIAFGAAGIADLAAMIAGVNNGFVIHTDSTNARRFRTRQYATEALWPTLTVTYR